jgi:hypothetical protein
MSATVEVARKSYSRVGLIFATIGAFFIALQVYVVSTWMLSPAFRATPIGADPIPANIRATLDHYQTTAIAVGSAALIWLIQGIVRTGRIDKWRLLMLGWLSAYWLDPWLDFLRPMFTYNSYMFNRGCWCKFIPFWRSPAGDRIAEPLIIVGSAYFWNFALVCFLAYAVMRWLRNSRPGASWAGAILCGFAAIWVTMSMLDLAATRFMGFDAWPIATPSVTLWAGRPYQFPLYEFILFPSQFVVCALVMMRSGSEPGTTIIESGLERLPGATRTAARVLAFVALCNLSNLVYTTALGAYALRGGTYPANMPSWLADQQCGPQTPATCQAPREPPGSVND